MTRCTQSNLNMKLVCSIKRNQLVDVQSLIKEGANVKFKDKRAQSVLAIAAHLGHIDIVKLLLENGAIIESICMDRALNGINKNVQSDILRLFSEWGWINLYVDDLRDIPEGFVGARTTKDAIKRINDCNVHLLSLDHDLGQGADEYSYQLAMT